MAIKLLSDLVTVVSEHISNPSTSGFEIFVGLEHYDAGEPVITRYGSTANLESSVKHFIEGDILVARRNVYLKRAGVVKFEGVTSGDSIVLRVKDDSYKDIIPFVLNTEDFWDYAEQNSDGTMSKRLAPDVLLEYECDIPDNHREIAAKLWAAYELKEAYKKMIAATDEMVKSQFIEMFGNPVEWQNDDSIPVLSDTVDVISGYPFDAEQFNSEGNGVALIRIRDIQRGYTETFTTEAFDEKYRINKGDLLIGMDGMFDIARWQSASAALNQRVCCLRMKDAENDIFIQYLVQPILKHIELGTNATTVKHLSTKQINAIRIPKATECQKSSFASIVKQADKSKYIS